MVDVLETYGLPTVKSNALPKYELVNIAGKSVLPTIMAKLFETNVPILVKKGFIDLDEVLWQSTDPTIKQWLPHIEKECPNKKPFCGRKLFIGNIKCNQKYKDKISWFYGTTKGIGAYGVIFPYQMDECLPNDVISEVSALDQNPDVAPDAIDKIIENYFAEKGYTELEVSFFIKSDGDKNPVRDKTNVTLNDLVKSTEKRIDQDKAIVGFVAPKLNKSAKTVKVEGKPDELTIEWSLNVDDIIFIKPKSSK